MCACVRNSRIPRSPMTPFRSRPGLAHEASPVTRKCSSLLKAEACDPRPLPVCVSGARGPRRATKTPQTPRLHAKVRPPRGPGVRWALQSFQGSPGLAPRPGCSRGSPRPPLVPGNVRRDTRSAGSSGSPAGRRSSARRRAAECGSACATPRGHGGSPRYSGVHDAPSALHTVSSLITPPPSPGAR